MADGTAVGAIEGLVTGTLVGAAVGVADGEKVGAAEGTADGFADGFAVGLAVGCDRVKAKCIQVIANGKRDLPQQWAQRLVWLLVYWMALWLDLELAEQEITIR